MKYLISLIVLAFAALSIYACSEPNASQVQTKIVVQNELSGDEYILAKAKERLSIFAENIRIINYKIEAKNDYAFVAYYEIIDPKTKQVHPFLMDYDYLTNTEVKRLFYLGTPATIAIQ